MAPGRISMLNATTLTAALSVLMTVMSFLQRWLVAMVRVRKAYRALRAKRAERKQRIPASRRASSRPMLRRRPVAVRRAFRPAQVTLS